MRSIVWGDRKSRLLLLLCLLPLSLVLGCRREGQAAESKSSSGSATAPRLSDEELEQIALDAARARAARAAARKELARQKEEDAERRREEERKRKRRVYDTLMASDGFDLVEGGLEEWGASVVVLSKDPVRMQFEGKARLRWRMPFVDVPVDGRVDGQGRLLISGVVGGGTVVLDEVSVMGDITGDDWTAEAKSSRRQEKRKLQDAMMNSVVAQEASYVTELWDRYRYPEEMSSVQLVFPRAKVRTGDHDLARAWFDGKFKDGYRTSSGDVAVSVRYLDEPKSSGIVFGYYGPPGTSVKARVVVNGSLTIDVRMPHNNYMLAEFDKDLTMSEVFVECRAGHVGFSEIALVAPRD